MHISEKDHQAHFAENPKAFVNGYDAFYFIFFK